MRFHMKRIERYLYKSICLFYKTIDSKSLSVSVPIFQMVSRRVYKLLLFSSPLTESNQL